MLGLPIFMPEDRAIPVKGIPALPRVTRAFVRDKKLLQREQKPGISPALWTAAYLAVLVLAAALLAGIVLGLRRIERALSAAPGEPPAAGPQPTPRVASVA